MGDRDRGRFDGAPPSMESLRKLTVGTTFSFFPLIAGTILGVFVTVGLFSILQPSDPNAQVGENPEIIVSPNERWLRIGSLSADRKAEVSNVIYDSDLKKLFDGLDLESNISFDFEDNPFQVVVSAERGLNVRNSPNTKLADNRVETLARWDRVIVVRIAIIDDWIWAQQAQPSG